MQTKLCEFVDGVSVKGLPLKLDRVGTPNMVWNRCIIAFVACCIVVAISGVVASPSTPIIPVHHWSRYFTAPSYTRLPLIRGAVATLGDAASDLDTVLRVVKRRNSLPSRSPISSSFYNGASSSPDDPTSLPLPPVRKRIRASPYSHATRQTTSTARHRLHSMTSNVANGSPLVGCASLDFSIPVMLGMSGSTVFQLLFDTGSSTLAVAGSSCTTCSSAGVSPTYAASGTTVGTTSSAYGDNSGWSGNVYTDTVTVAGSTSNAAVTPAVSMKLASITQQTNAFFSAGTCSDRNSASSPWQGIIGFAYQSLATTNTDSFPYKLIQQTTGSSSPYANEFYVEMCINDGALWFSGMSLSSYSGQFNYVPISVQTYYQVVVSSINIGSSVVGSNLGSSQSIVDSGTSMWSLPSSTYKAAIAKINSNSQFSSWLGSNFWSATSCISTPAGQSIASMNAALPTLSVTFGNGVIATLPAIGSYVIPCDSSLTSWQHGIGDSGDTTMTMGWSFMNVFVVHHDIANSRIGFAVATGCSPMYTPTGSGAAVSGNPSGPTGTGVGGATVSSSSTASADGSVSSTGASSTVDSSSSAGGASSSTATAAGSGSSTADAAATGASSTAASTSSGGSSSSTTSGNNPSASDTSSSASSSGSSTTGGGASSTSSGSSDTTTSTGGSSDTGSGGLTPEVVIPNTFPFICTNLRFNSLLDANTQYDIMSNVASDIASVAGVSSSRVLVISTQNLDSSVTQVRFTITDALVASQPATVDVTTRFINALSKTENPFTDKTTYPYLQYATVGGTRLCSSQSELTSLPVVQFGMSYSIDSLPGGNVISFADQIRTSLASVCSTSPSRIVVNSVVAGSVLVAFVVSDSRTNASDISSQQAVDNFVSRVASNDGSSSGLLSQVMANSTKVSNVGAAIAAAANANQLGIYNGGSSSSNTTTIIIIAVACAGGVIFIVVCWALYAYCFKSDSRLAKGAMAHETAKVKPQQEISLASQRNTTSGQRIGFSATDGSVHLGPPQAYAANVKQSQPQRGHLPGAPTLSHSNVQVLVAPPVMNIDYSPQLVVPVRGPAQ